MRKIDIARDLQRSGARDAVAFTGDLGKFTPAEFLKEAGTVIAVCLGLSLLMQLLLG